MGNCLSGEAEERVEETEVYIGRPRLNTTTSLQLQEEDLEWRIENFRLIARSNKSARGDMNELAYKFSFGNEISVPTTWKFYLELEKGKKNPMVGLYLSLVNYKGPQKELWVEYGFSVIKNGQTLQERKLRKPVDIKKEDDDWGWRNIGRLSYILDKCVGDDSSLVIRFHMTQFTRNAFTETKPLSPIKEIDTRKWRNSFLTLQDFSTLITSGIHSDFQISVEGNVLPVHKAILAARSSVFGAMFQSGMKETSSGTINIEDIKYRTMQLLVEFIYSGCIKEHKFEVASIHELVYAADKYCVKGLLDLCEEEIMKIINTSNAVEFHSLAKKHGMKKAIPATAEYISKHIQTILQSSQNGL